MSYDAEQERKRRIVVETPTARREVVQTETDRVPERRGVSTGVVALVAIMAIAITAIAAWALMRNNETTSDNTNVRIAATQPTPAQPPVIVQQQPAPVQQQPPVIIQQPAPAAPPQTVVVPVPQTSSPASSTTNTTGTTNTNTASSASVPDDATIQASIERKFSEDPTFSSLGLSVMVLDGKVTLTGTVNNSTQKRLAERMVRSMKGVRNVDNQLTVSESGLEE